MCGWTLQKLETLEERFFHRKSFVASC